MTPALVEAILAHGVQEAPREACGLLVWDGRFNATYAPCRNLAGAERFEIHPEDWAAAEDTGKILGVVHTHPGGQAKPSQADLAGCEMSGLPWWIFDLAGDWVRIVPSRWSVTGHPFAWGVQDCFTVVRDLFPGIPDLIRWPEFWNTADLFRSQALACGFGLADGHTTKGDVLLFAVQSRDLVPNHCAVYQGYGEIIHHLPGRLSRREQLGPLGSAVISTMRRCA